MLRKDWMKNWTLRSGWLMVAALAWMGLPAAALTSSYVQPIVATSTGAVAATNLPGDLGNVALDACGNIYTVNEGSGQIVEIPYGGGAATTVLGATSYGTASLSINASKSDLYALQGFTGSVTQIPISNCAPQTNAQSSIGIGNLGAISYYWGGSAVATDSSNNVFIATNGACCASNNELLVEYPGFATGATLLSSLADPITSIAIDSSDNIYYVTNGALYELTVKTAATSTAPPVYSATPVLFGSGYTSVVGVSFDAAGNLYVADEGTSGQYPINGYWPPLYFSSVLYEIPNETTTANGTTTSALNPADQFMLVEGSGTANPLTFANAVTVAPSGIIYFTDNGSDNSVYAMTRFSANAGSVAVNGNETVTVNVVFNAAETPASITFAPDSPFTATGGTCATGTSYTAGQSCTITSKFAPTAPGVSVGGMTLADASNNVLATAYLKGTGLGAGLTLDSGTVTSIGSGFVSPESIAVVSSGGFIADRGGNAVLFFATPTSAPVSIGTGLSKPSGVTVDGAGNVIIADTGNDRIVEVPMVSGALSNAAQITITPTTTNSNSNVVPAPIAGEALSGPAGVTIDGLGNLYIADTGNNRIVYVPYNGSWNFAQASVLGSGFDGPLATAVDPWGNLYVADSGVGQIYKLQAPVSSGIQQLAAVGYSNPTALATDASGSLFVVDQGDGAIYRIPAVSGALDPNTAIQVGFGIADPYGVALDGSGDLYVTDATNAAAYEVDRTSTTENFGSWAVNSPSGPLPVQVENEGNQSLIFNTPFNTATGDTGDFSLGTPSNACADGATVVAGAGCEMDAIFQPTASGTRTETLVLASNARNASAPQVVLTGSGSTATATATSLAITSPATGSPSFGQSITLAATVTSSGGTPTGGAELVVDGTITAQATLSSGGVATFTLATGLTGGSHSLQAVYLGSSSFSGSSSSLMGVTVSTAATTTTLAISAPNTSPYSVLSGGSVTLTATVGFVGVGIPTGTVTFVTGSTNLGSVTLAPGAGGAFQASLSTTALPLGNNTITATYSGDANYVGSSVTGGPIDVVSAPEVIVTASSTAISTSGNSSTGATFTNTSYGGWQGIVGYHCDPTTLPANSICVFSPGQVPVSPSTSSVTYPAATTTLSVVTNNPPNSPAQSSMLWWLGGLSGLSLLFLRRRMMRGAWAAVTMTIAVLLLAGSAAGLMACSSTTYVTPAGTSTVTVYADSDPYVVSSSGAVNPQASQPCGSTDPTSGAAYAPCVQQTFQVSLTVE